MILSCLTLESCRFIRNTSFNGSSFSVQPLGLFRIFQGSQCVPFKIISDAQNPTSVSQYSIPGSIRAAQAFGVIAALLGGGAVFLLLLPLVKRVGRVLWFTAGGLSFAAFISQSLTFLIFNEEDCKTSRTFPDGGGAVQCAIDEGGGFAVTAMVMYVLAGILVCRTTAPLESPLFTFGTEKPKTDKHQKSENFDNEQAPTPGGNFESEQALPPPGTRRTVTETINADGSRTVYVTTTRDFGESGDGSDDVASSTAARLNPAGEHSVWIQWESIDWIGVRRAHKFWSIVFEQSYTADEARWSIRNYLCHNGSSIAINRFWIKSTILKKRGR